MLEIINAHVTKKLAAALTEHQDEIDKAIKDFCKPKNLRRVVGKLAAQAIAKEIETNLHLNENLKALKAR